MQAGTALLRVAGGGERLRRASSIAGVDGRWLAGRERRALLREVLGDLAQVAVGQIRDEVVHRRVLARAVAKRHELVVEIAGRLAGDAREVPVARALAALAVAGHAALHARLHRVELLERRDRGVLRVDAGRSHQRACGEQRASRRAAVPEDSLQDAYGTERDLLPETVGAAARRDVNVAATFWQASRAPALARAFPRSPGRARAPRRSMPAATSRR